MEEEIKQKYFKGFCKVEDKITIFVTHVDDESILCCTTCGFRKIKDKLDKERKD